MFRAWGKAEKAMGEGGFGDGSWANGDQGKMKQGGRARGSREEGDWEKWWLRMVENGRAEWREWWHGSPEAAQRCAVAAAATAVGLLPRPSVSSHLRWRRLLSFLK